MPIPWKLCIKLIVIYPRVRLSIAVHGDDHFAKITGFHAFPMARAIRVRVRSTSEIETSSRAFFFSAPFMLCLSVYACCALARLITEHSAAKGAKGANVTVDQASPACGLFLLKFVLSASARPRPKRHVLFFTAIGSAFGNRQHRLPAVSCHVPSRYDTSSKGGGLSYCGTSPERFLRDSRSYLRRFEIENSEANCATCVSFIQARPVGRVSTVWGIFLLCARTLVNDRGGRDRTSIAL